MSQGSEQSCHIDPNRLESSQSSSAKQTFSFAILRVQWTNEGCDTVLCYCYVCFPNVISALNRDSTALRGADKYISRYTTHTAIRRELRIFGIANTTFTPFIPRVMQSINCFDVLSINTRSESNLKQSSLKKNLLPGFYRTRRVIIVFTWDLHWSLSWARSIQSIPNNINNTPF
jgi:hypothetical protein